MQPPSPHPRTQIQAEIVADYLALRSAPQVAAKRGISSTRVLEVLRKAGINAAQLRRELDAKAYLERERVRQAAKREAASLRTQQIERDLEEKYTEWRALWAAGLSISQMSKRLGQTVGYIAATVHMHRKRRGWFPYRRPPATKTAA